MLTLEALLLRQGDFRLEADWAMPAGGVTAIIGPSGAGKSTLLSAIAGFLEPAAGDVIWNGETLTRKLPSDRPVAMIFQDNNLFPHLDIRTNVVLGRTTARRVPQEDLQAADQALEDVGLSGMGSRKPAALSGGQQSRAALARVLISDRPVILLDEPFSALGPALRSEMLELTTKLAAARGATILMVTHDPDDARRFADHVVFVDGGIAAAPQPTEALFADPPPALATYLGI